jgi:hypothetical protein
LKTNVGAEIVVVGGFYGVMMTMTMVMLMMMADAECTDK